MQALVQSFFDPATWTATHVVHGEPGSACAIIDPVLDYDPKSGRTRTDSAAKVAAFVREQRLQVEWILETHAHADHLSAAAWLQRELGGRIGIGRGITRVQDVFKKLFNLEPGFETDGSQFGHLFADGETFAIGALQAQAIAMPGHTPACVAYRVGDAVFVGDTLFAPKSGSARCDFPGGDAAALHASIRRLYELPDATRVFLCHDYPAADAAPVAEIALAEQKRGNVHVRDDTDAATFVALRTTRDATLAVPRLLWPAVQFNIRGGRLPPDGAFFRLPVAFAADEMPAPARIAGTDVSATT